MRGRTIKIGALLGISLALFAIAGRAEPSASEIIQQVVARPAVRSQPELPVLSAQVRNGAESEMAADQEITAAMRVLAGAQGSGEREKGLGVLAKKRAVWCLQATLGDFRGYPHGRALKALREIGDPRAVRFLLIYGSAMDVPVPGGDLGASHELAVAELIATLSALTGEKVRPAGPRTPGDLRAGMRRWAAWLVENEKE